jgi:hypothetical protein
MILLSRAIWALTLGLGVMAGLARGADVPAPGGIIVPPTGLLILPPSPCPSGYSPAAAPSIEMLPPLPPLPTPNGLVRCAVWKQRPCGCWAHHNLMGCGSFASEMRYIFGSCRAFFGSCCFKEQPALPVTPCPKPYLPSPDGSSCSSCP